MKYRGLGESTPIPSILLKGVNHPSVGLTSPKTSTSSRERGGTALKSHSIPFAGIRHHLDVRPALALGTSLTCAASCPDRVLARDLRQIAAPITARNFFILSKCQSHRLAARMQCHEGMHLLEQGSGSPGNERMLPIGWANIQISLPSECYRLRFSPRHTRQPLHEAANLLYNHYRYL